MIKDKYSKVRGKSKVLEISCSNCFEYICNYQKDGPGNLRRMYYDRINNAKIKIDPEASKNISCPKCNTLIGTLTTYKKENRLAYATNHAGISKKVIK